MSKKISEERHAEMDRLTGKTEAANTVTLNLTETDTLIAILRSDPLLSAKQASLRAKLEHAAFAARQSLWREQYEAVQAKTEAEADTCRYCKAARTRNVKQDAMCKKHRERSRLNYVTSPVSESYWAN